MKHILLSFVGAILLFIIAATTVQAEEIEVKKGDTLWGYSQQYEVSIESIKQWNNLTSHLIYPGSILTIHNETPPAESVVTVAQTEQPLAQPTGRELIVESTAYTAFCAGCSGITATGVNLRANPETKVIAVDPSFIPLGSKVYIEGYGYATAEDTGGAIKGNKIDVFFPNKSDAIQWGRKQVKITIMES